MGGCQFELGQLMGSHNQTQSFELSHNGKHMGTLIIKADKVDEQNNRITFRATGSNIKQGCFASTTSFITFELF